MIKRSSFKPAWWLRNPHLQTVWPTMMNAGIQLNTRREKFSLPDGDFLQLDWINEDEKDENRPIVVVLHGLGGSIASPYSTRLLHAIAESGWSGVLMHFRGSGGEHNLTERSYHAGDTDDLKEFIIYLREKFPHVPLAAVGVSLGGNVLLKWLGESGLHNPLDCAIAVSVPFDLNKVLNRFNKGLSRFYSRYLLNSLRSSILDKFSAANISTFNLDKIKQAHDFSEFDNYFTAPVHGFAHAYDYYQRASSRYYLKDITVPTLIIHAKDDPFMTPDAIPHESELSNEVILELSEQGGHVGFVEAEHLPWRIRYWLDSRVTEFLKNYL